MNILSEKECRERYYRNTLSPEGERDGERGFIIDAHSHLWLWQHTEVNGKEIRQEPNGRSSFLGIEKQMMNPWMQDNYNSAEKFLANMDYAQVAGAIVTQEFIDGLQNDYLEYVGRRWSDRFFVFGMCEFRRPGFLIEAEVLVRRGFKGIKLCAGRVADQQRMDGAEETFTNDEFMAMYHLMEDNGMILGLELSDGATQCAEVEKIVSECPRLKIVLGHFAMVGRPDWMEQMRLARHENVYVDMGGITWLFHDEYWPYPSAIKAIREAADEVGIDKLLWGSDYPRTITAITYRQSYDWILKTREFTDEEKAKLLGLNAQRVYGFTPKAELPYVESMSE